MDAKGAPLSASRKYKIRYFKADMCCSHYWYITKSVSALDHSAWAIYFLYIFEIVS